MRIPVLVLGVAFVAMVPSKLLGVTTAEVNAAPDVDVERAAEQVEIMRVVLTKTINERAQQVVARSSLGRKVDDAVVDRLFGAVGFVDQDGTPIYAPRTTGFQRTSHTRGFYAPGVGAWFSTEITAPLVRAKAELPERDAWEEARAQVVEGSSGTTAAVEHVDRTWLAPGTYDPVLVRRRTVKRAIDDSFVDETVAVVIETIAKYGRRIDVLGDHENIVVALQFTADHSQLTVSNENASDSSSTKTVVIRAPRAVLRDGITADELEDRCIITRY